MKKSTKKAAEIGAGVVTAAALAAAAAYWFTSKTTKNQRTKAKAWLQSARRDVIKNARSARKFGEREYGQMVDQAVRKYGSLENMSIRDIRSAAEQLKAEWKRIQAHAKKSVRTTKKPAAKKKVRKTKRTK